MKIFFIVPHYYSPTPEVRIKPLINELEKYGAQCTIIKEPSKVSVLNPVQKHIFPYDASEVFKVIGCRKDFDVLFINRVSSFLIMIIQKFWEKFRRKVIFDFDDPVFLPTRMLKLRSPLFDSFEKIAEKSGAVTTSSHSMLFYAKTLNPNSFLIHTPVDITLFKPSTKKNDKIIIGWIGHAFGHLENLKMLRPVLTKLGNKYDISFKMVSYLGDLRVKKAFKKVEEVIEVDYGLDRWVPFNKLSRVVSDFDIGVSPMVRTPWFEGKSIIKTAMYMAMGLPTVASPVGEQKYVIKHGFNGFLADGEDEWIRDLSILIEDCGLRKKMGNEGRKTAEQKLSVNVCGKQLFKVIKNLM